MIDAGGGGAWTYDDCRRYWEGRCKTDVYAFVHDNGTGIFTGGRALLDLGNRQDHMTTLGVSIDEWREVVDRNRDRILAIKTGVHTYHGFDHIRRA